MTKPRKKSARKAADPTWEFRLGAKPTSGKSASGEAAPGKIHGEFKIAGKPKPFRKAMSDATLDDLAGELKLAAVYARKSNANDIAVSGQFDTCRQRARRDGWLVPESSDFLFGDDATSGKKTVRDELQRLVALVRSGAAPFQRVYIRHRDRLTRSADLDFRPWFEFECRQAGIQVCYASDDRHRDIRSGERTDLAQHVVERLDDYKSHTELAGIRERVTIGARQRVAKGFFIGAVAPYGAERWLATYDEHRTPVARMPERGGIRLEKHAVILRWCEPRVPTIRFIFDALEGGASLRTVARELNDRGDPRPSNIETWSAAVVSRIARNPVYMGDYHFKRTVEDAGDPVPAEEAEDLGHEGIYVRDFIADAPVSREQYTAVQRLLHANRERQERRMASSPEYPLTGLIRCSICGARLNGTTHPGGKRTEAYRQYRHPPKDRCRVACPFTSHTMRADAVDELVLESVGALLIDRRLVEQARGALDQLRGEVHAAERARSIAAIRDRIRTLRAEIDIANKRSMEQEAAGERELAESTLRLAKEKVEARKQYEQQLATLEEEDTRLRKVEQGIPALEEEAAALATMFRSGAVDRKAVLRHVLSAVSVDFQAYHATVSVRTPFPRPARDLRDCA